VRRWRRAKSVGGKRERVHLFSIATRLAVGMPTE
jgi:hypothetical protein